MLYDREIREPLFEFLEEIYGKVRILEEKQMGRSRADAVMVVPDALFGIEIKSDADTYARLNRQVRDYDQYFDANYVVVGVSHAMHIEEHVPAWWGIITAEPDGERVDFYILRKASGNPKMVPKKKLGLLWRPELSHILEQNRLPGYRQKSKAFVVEKILEKVPQEVLKRQICQELFERDYQMIEETIREYKKKHRGKK
ncbi:MAG: sce7726 family protein [Lachnospiraceae bacterium]|nr:sce7726 family protein [Lachnospiraceae bacterium]